MSAALVSESIEAPIRSSTKVATSPVEEGSRPNTDRPTFVVGVEMFTRGADVI